MSRSKIAFVIQCSALQMHYPHADKKVSSIIFSLRISRRAGFLKTVKLFYRRCPHARTLKIETVAVLFVCCFRFITSLHVGISGRIICPRLKATRCNLTVYFDEGLLFSAMQNLRKHAENQSHTCGLHPQCKTLGKNVVG